MNNSTRLGADGDIGGEKAYQKSLEFAFEVVLMSVIGVLGLAGNVAAIWLFSHQSRQLKFHRLMTMLAIYDLLYIALSLTLFTLPQISADYKLSGAHFFVLPRCEMMTNKKHLKKAALNKHYDFLIQSQELNRKAGLL